MRSSATVVTCVCEQQSDLNRNIRPTDRISLMLHSGSRVRERVCVESYVDSVVPNSAFHAVPEAFLTLLWKQLTNRYHGNRDAPTQRGTDGMSSTNSC